MASGCRRIMLARPALVLALLMTFFASRPTLAADLDYAATPPPEPRKPLPHIVLSVADDLAYYDLGYMNPRAVSPTLDALARSGIILNRHYSSRQCAPSRAALQSGRLPFEIGLNTDFNLTPAAAIRCAIPKSADPLLSKVLQQAGYKTHGVGKWHGGHYNKASLPTSRGFDSFFGYLPGFINKMNPGYLQVSECFCDSDEFNKQMCVNAPQKRTGRPISYQCPSLKSLVNITSLGKFVPAVSTGTNYADFLFAQEAVRIINAHSLSNPLFLYLAWASPHLPLEAPANFIEQINIKNGSDSYLEKSCGPSFLAQRRIHLGMVAALDTAVSQVVNALHARGLWNNTIFVFLSDNGGIQPDSNPTPKSFCKGNQMGFNYPLRGGKYSWWEGGIRTLAFAVLPPTILRGKTTMESYDGLFSVSDYYATLLTLAGVGFAPLPNSVDHSQAWLGAKAPPRTSLVPQFFPDADRFTVIAQMSDGKLWKMIHGFPALGWVGFTNGFQSPVSAQSPPLNGLFQPPELPPDSMNKSIISSENYALRCTPKPCLFQITDDPSEQNELFSLPSSQSVIQALQAVIDAQAVNYAPMNQSGLCQNGWYASYTLETTDGLALSTSLTAGYWTWWVA